METTSINNEGDRRVLYIENDNTMVSYHKSKIDKKKNLLIYYNFTLKGPLTVKLIPVTKEPY